MKLKNFPLTARLACLTASLLAASPAAYSFDGTFNGCFSFNEVGGVVGQVGVSNQLSSFSGAGGVNTSFRLWVFDNDGADFHVGTPVVVEGGNTVTMLDSSEGVFYITDSRMGYNRTPMTAAGLYFGRGITTIQIEYTGESVAALNAGAYTVTGVTSCIRR